MDFKGILVKPTHTYTHNCVNYYPGKVAGKKIQNCIRLEQ